MLSLHRAICAYRTGFGRALFHSSPCASGTKKNIALKTNSVALSRDGSVIVCWHPEPEYPYEFTRPMPRNETEAKMGDSPVKVQTPAAYLKSDKLHGPKDSDLAKIFNEYAPAFRHKPFLRKKLYHRRKRAKDRESI